MLTCEFRNSVKAIAGAVSATALVDSNEVNKKKQHDGQWVKMSPRLLPQFRYRL